jgi:hypothetical protein
LTPNESRLSGGRVSPPSAQHLPYPQVSSPSEPPPGVARPLQALVRQNAPRDALKRVAECRNLYQASASLGFRGADSRMACASILNGALLPRL